MKQIKERDENKHKIAVTIAKHFGRLLSDRPNWDSHWQEVAELFLPRKDDIHRDNVSGEKKGQKVFDATGPHVVELLASALHSMLTNPINPWFELTTGVPSLDKDDEVRGYLQQVTDIMLLALANSNFQTEIHELYLNLVTFGTGTMLIEEDEDTTVRFQTRDINEIFLEENNKGFVDTVFRVFKWSVRNIVQEWGEEILEQDYELARLYEKEPERKMEIIHVVFPTIRNSLGLENLVSKKVYKTTSVYVMKTKPVVLSMGGFREFPYVTPRWTKLSSEVYGRSPAMKVLPDVKMINEVEKTRIRAAQKVVDPPMQMPDDGILLPLRLTPGGINYYRAGTQDRIEPILTGGRPDLAENLILDLRNRIREGFYIDQLQLNNNAPQMTATEVIQRTEENLRILSPILGRQQFELLNPAIDRLYPIMDRAGKLPAAPEALQGTKVSVRYTSMIARAQKTLAGENFNRVMQIMTPMFSFDPTVIDIFKLDKTAEHIAKAFGLPQEILRNDAELAELKKGREDAQSQEQQSQQNLNDAEVVNKVAPHIIDAQKNMQG